MSNNSIPRVSEHKHNFVDHLQNPYCKKQSTAQKAATIFLHIVLFPLGIYRIGQAIYSHCFKRSAIPAPQQNNQSIIPQKTAVASVKNQRYLLETGPNAQTICKLTDSFANTHLPAFKKALKDNQENPYQTTAVRSAANNLMKIAFEISSVALADLDPFVKSLSQVKSKTEQDRLKESYLQRIYACGDVYHKLKAGSVWSDEANNIVLPLEPVSDEFRELFHQDNTLERGWNTYYNNICTQINTYLDAGNPFFGHVSGDRIRWSVRDAGIPKDEEIRQIGPNFVLNPPLLIGHNSVEIALKMNLYHDKYMPAFEKALKDNQKNTWEQPAVIQAANILMTTAYDISRLALDDYRTFLLSLKMTTSNDRVKNLTHNYLSRVYLCGECYHLMRAGMAWSVEKNDVEEQSSPEFLERFSQNGTMQNTWTYFYNFICKRIKGHLDQESPIFAEITEQQISWTAEY